MTDTALLISDRRNSVRERFRVFVPQQLGVRLSQGPLLTDEHDGHIYGSANVDPGQVSPFGRENEWDGVVVDAQGRSTFFEVKALSYPAVESTAIGQSEANFPELMSWHQTNTYSGVLLLVQANSLYMASELDSRTTQAEPSPIQEPEWIADLLKQCSDVLEGFKELEAGWDSYGAEPIKPEAVMRAREVLALVYIAEGLRVAAPFVSPLPNGGVELEWTLHDIGLLIEVPPGSGPVEYYVVGLRPEQEIEGEAEEVWHLRPIIRRVGQAAS